MLSSRIAFRQLGLCLKGQVRSHTTRTIASEPVKSQPEFSRQIIRHLSPEPGQTVLDMTFGTGSHSQLILERLDNVTLLASDIDRGSYELAERLSATRDDIFPLRSRFSQLHFSLDSLEVKPGSLDAILLDTGCSALQLKDQSRGFNYLDGDSILDLRYDPDLEPDNPTASDYLLRLEDRQLERILRHYGSMVVLSRHIATAILEARYMFHQFKSVQDLSDIVRTAAINMSNRTGDDVDKLQQRMLMGTMQALRAFVNDELHELEFALSAIAENYLKPNSGKLFLITHVHSEDLIARSVLASASGTEYFTQSERVRDDDVENIRKHPWNILCDVTKTRVSNSNLIIAQRTDVKRKKAITNQ